QFYTLSTPQCTGAGFMKWTSSEMVRQAYPRDVSAEEWALIAPYLTLMTAEAPQQEHNLCEVCNGILTPGSHEHRLTSSTLAQRLAASMESSLEGKRRTRTFRLVLNALRHQWNPH